MESYLKLVRGGCSERSGSGGYPGNHLHTSQVSANDKGLRSRVFTCQKVALWGPTPQGWFAWEIGHRTDDVSWVSGFVSLQKQIKGANWPQCSRACSTDLDPPHQAMVQEHWESFRWGTMPALLGMAGQFYHWKQLSGTQKRWASLGNIPDKPAFTPPGHIKRTIM